MVQLHCPIGVKAGASLKDLTGQALLGQGAAANKLPTPPPSQPASTTSRTQAHAGPHERGSKSAIRGCLGRLGQRACRLDGRHWIDVSRLGISQRMLCT